MRYSNVVCPASANMHFQKLTLDRRLALKPCLRSLLTSVATILRSLFVYRIQYNYVNALRRLATAATSPTYKFTAAAHSEELLLRTYSVTLPDRLTTPQNARPGRIDDTATGVLRLFHPIVLHIHVPLYVVGDGNCLFRAVSRALYGTEQHHLLIRLLTAIEIAKNPPIL